MDIDEIVQNVGNKLLEYGATNVQILEIESKTNITKRLLLCTASNNQNAKAYAYNIKEQIKEFATCLHTDGIFKGDWVVLDYKDFIIHIFTKETRVKYNLEKLYKDSKNCITLTSKKQ